MCLEFPSNHHFVMYAYIQPTKNSSGNLTCGRWNITIHGKITDDDNAVQLHACII